MVKKSSKKRKKPERKRRVCRDLLGDEIEDFAVLKRDILEALGEQAKQEKAFSGERSVIKHVGSDGRVVARSGRIYLPKEWVGREVCVKLLK